MKRVRFVLTVLLTLAIGVAGCGGDDDGSGGDAGSAATTGGQGQTGTQGESGAQPDGAGDDARARRDRSRAAGGERRERRQGRRRSLSRRDAGGKEPTPQEIAANRRKLKGTERVIYTESRLRCRTIPRETLARAYHAESEGAEDVARAFAEREQPDPKYRLSSYQGCLDGLFSNR
jgi:hypothetical protein